MAIDWEASAFTVAELGKMLPYRINIKNIPYRIQFKKLDKQWCVAYFPPQPFIGFDETDVTEADTRAKILIYLLDEGLYGDQMAKQFT